MASIKINDIQLNGSDLFNDSESYLSELTQSELIDNHGGSTPTSTLLFFGGSMILVTLM